jgi:hypothetical protein
MNECDFPYAIALLLGSSDRQGQAFHISLTENPVCEDVPDFAPAAFMRFMIGSGEGSSLDLRSGESCWQYQRV